MARSRLILVTGASGFIGNALCRRLRDRGRVRALLRRGADGPWDESVRADLAADSPLDHAVGGVDTIFHLAAKTHDTSAREGPAAEFERVNVDGTRRLLQAAAAAGVQRFVYLSSVKAMGEGGKQRLDENLTPAPRTPYGRSKRKAEELVLGNPHIPHTSVVRSCLIYGAGAKGNIARMIHAVEHGFFPPIPRVENVRSMVHVDDVVQALILAAEKDEANGGVFIVTDGEAYSTRQIYEWICRALGRQVPRWTVPMPFLRGLAKAGDGIGRVRGRRFVFDSPALEKLFGSAYYDSTRIRETLGYRPRRKLQDAVPEMVRADRPGDHTRR